MKKGRGVKRDGRLLAAVKGRVRARDQWFEPCSFLHRTSRVTSFVFWPSGWNACAMKGTNSAMPGPATLLWNVPRHALSEGAAG
jgi:hypothetical protein